MLKLSRVGNVVCVLAVLWLACASAHASEPATDATVECLAPDARLTYCTVDRSALASAQKLYDQGLRFEKNGQGDVALRRFEAASDQMPQSVEFSTAREIMRQKLVFDHIELGNRKVASGQSAEGQAEFEMALKIDPDNSFARERLEESLAPVTEAARQSVEVVEDSGVLEVAPKSGTRSFHLRGTSQSLLTQVASAFGVTVVFEDNVPDRPVRFDIDDVDFFDAMQSLGSVTQTFWTPLEAQQIFIARESAENHKLYDRLVYRTFYLPGAQPIELTDIVTTLKTMFDLRWVNQQAGSATISVRAPQRSMEAMTALIQNLSYGRPQVVLDVQVIEVSRQFTRKLGLDAGPQFNLMNIPAGALAGLLGGNSQNLINQLISSGAINQAGNTALAALLAQLQAQAGSLFSQPVATFGGGLTLFGLSLPSPSFNFSVNDSDIKSLQRATLRAASGDTATMKIGSRYPILNASFAPIFSNPAISQLLQNNTFQAPFPSFNFEDIGLMVKAKPFLNEHNDVTMELEMELRALGTQSFNGIPVISNRQYKGTIRVQDGEPAVMIGMVTSSELKSYHGVPGIGQLPVVREFTSGSDGEHTDDELMVIITPHVVREANAGSQQELWLSPAR